jgi:hypothetical protein
MEESGQLHAPAGLLQGKGPWYQLDKRLGGSQSRSGHGGEEKNSQALPGLEPPIVLPVAHWAIPAPAVRFYMFYTYLQSVQLLPGEAATQQPRHTFWYVLVTYESMQLNVCKVLMLWAQHNICV